MRDGWLDLFLGSSCAGCGGAGRLLCTDCAAGLPDGARLTWPSPCPTGLAPPFAAGEYAGLLKTLINAHKERHQFSLARPLGRVLACAVSAATAGAPTVLVPVPSRGGVVRQRGHDPLLRVSRVAAATLRGAGQHAVVVRLLRPVGPVRDQTGLSAEERAANLRGSMACPPRRVRAAAALELALAVVVDDVITTGSTVREAQRALESSGVAVAAVAAVAATRRRRLTTRGDPGPGERRPPRDSR